MYVSITAFIIAVIVTIIVVLIIREIVCWYYKINTIIGLLEDINIKLDKIPSNEQSFVTHAISSNMIQDAKKRAQEIMTNQYVDDWVELNQIIKTLEREAESAGPSMVLVRLREFIKTIK